MKYERGSVKVSSQQQNENIIWIFLMDVRNENKSKLNGVQMSSIKDRMRTPSSWMTVQTVGACDRGLLTCNYWNMILVKIRSLSSLH